MRIWGRAALLGTGLLSCVASGVLAGTLSAEVDGVRVELTSLPERPRTEEATAYTLRLVNAGGEPVGGAKVTLQGRMADGMTVLGPLQPGSESGMYRGRLLFTMEGTWELTLRVRGQGKPFELRLIEQVGR